MALTRDKLAHFRKELLARREQLLRTLQPARQSGSEENHADIGDQVSADSDRRLENEMSNRDREYLMDLNGALRRIDDGTFGECVECGESIPEARMLAHPSTTLCIECKAELESEKSRFPGR